MTQPTPPEPTYRAGFAKSAGIAIAIGAVAVIALVAILLAMIDDDKAKELGADGQVAMRLLAAVLIVGVAVLALGIWMAVVEWYGTTKAEAQQAGINAFDVGPIIDAVGKLKGAALVIVVGGLLTFSVAWAAKDALPEPAATPTGTPSASPTGTG